MTGLAPAFHTIHWSPSFGGRPDVPAIVHAAADAGFGLIGLDLGTVDAYVACGGTLDSLARLLDDAGLGVTDVVALSLRPGDDPAALGGRLAAVIDAVGAPLCVAAVAESIGHRQVVMGFEAGLGPIADAGARLAVEFGRYMGLRTLPEAVAVCADLGWDRAGVLVDTYQCARAGTAIDEIAALGDGQVALVQVADAAGPAPSGDALVTEARHHRLLPGDGDLPLGKILAAVVATGYRGPVAGEVLSDAVRAADPATVAGRLHAALGPLVGAQVTP